MSIVMKRTKLKMRYGGGGTAMEDLHKLAEHCESNLMDLIPQEASLNFFV